MAVDVFQSKKPKEDPLDKLVKLTSIGVNVAGLAQKAGASNEPTAMDRRMDELKFGSSASNPKAGRSYGLGMKY